MTDEELMQAYQSGDSDAFDELYRRHAGRIYAFLRKRLGSAEEVDEVFQAVFLKVHRTRDSYNANYPVLQWLFVIARTAAIDRMRNAGRSDQLLQNFAASASLSQSQAVPDATLSELGALPDEQRRVVELRVLEDKDYQEIAELLGKSQEGVRQIYSRAIRKLRSMFTGPQGVRKS